MFILQKNPKSMVSEAYRTLRTNIEYSSFDKEIRSLVVTSTDPSEGKSTTAGNLAFSIAQSDKRVLIIDCDLRKPSLHKRFRVSNTVGLSDILLGNKKVSEGVYEFAKNLHIITSGKIPPNPAEMLGSKAMTKLLGVLKEQYDHIILDTAPVRIVTDAQILSTKVDGTILVIRAGVTKKETVYEAKQLLDKVKANVLGTVLNGVDNTKQQYYYYYGEEDSDQSDNKGKWRHKKKKKVK